MPLAQMRLALRILGAAELHGGVQRILEHRHPQAPLVLLVVVLVDEDHEQRHAAEAVVVRDRRRERREVDVGHHLVADIVDATGWKPTSEVVHPEHVVVSRRIDRPRDLERHFGAAHVRECIGVGERASDGAHDQRIDLVALVVLIGREGQLQGQPDEPRILPLRDQRAMYRFHDSEPTRVRSNDLTATCSRRVARISQPARKVSGCHRGERANVVGVVLRLAE